MRRTSWSTSNHDVLGGSVVLARTIVFACRLMMSGVGPAGADQSRRTAGQPWPSPVISDRLFAAQPPTDVRDGTTRLVHPTRRLVVPRPSTCR